MSDAAAPTVTPASPGDVIADPNAAPETGELPFYHPIPYQVDDDEDVTCPHCQLKNDTDATFCDQCGTELAGRDDVMVGDDTVTEPYSPEPYDPEVDETVQCPICEKRNDPDARFCDQCGTGLVGRSDVQVDGPYEDVDNVDVPSASSDGEPTAGDPDAAEENIDDDANRSQVPAVARRSDGDPVEPPKDNLIRSRYQTGVSLRSAGDGSGAVMYGHFSVFNTWYEIDSYWEGTFLERVASSAFDRTMTEDRDNMKVLYDHGFDPQLGNKPLGPITDLRADNIGAYYEVPLLDTDYNRDFVLPALEGRLMNGQTVGSQLGASFRFAVLDEMWEYNPEPSSSNPQGLPQRTITRAQVFEFGPVTFPASPSATAGVRSNVRSGTDRFVHHLHNDPRFLARFTERAGLKVVERFLATTATAGPVTASAANDSEPDDVRSARVNHLRRRARAALTL